MSFESSINFSFIFSSWSERNHVSVLGQGIRRLNEKKEKNTTYLLKEVDLKKLCSFAPPPPNIYLPQYHRYWCDFELLFQFTALSTADEISLMKKLLCTNISLVLHVSQLGKNWISVTLHSNTATIKRNRGVGAYLCISC